MLGERGLSLDALFSVRMPDNWTPTYDLSDKDEVAETNRRPTRRSPRSCLGYLHRCPKFAIQYDGRTRGHGQYRHPGTRV